MYECISGGCVNGLSVREWLDECGSGDREWAIGIIMSREILRMDPRTCVGWVNSGWISGGGINRAGTVLKRWMCSGNNRGCSSNSGTR